MNKRQALARAVTLIVIAAIGPSSTAFAQDKASKSPLHDVKRLVGKWNGTGTMKTEGKTFNVKAAWDCADAAGGSGVRCHMSITGLPGGFTYVVDDLWGHSAGDGLVHWYAVTNGGEVHDHRGHFDSNGGALEFDGPMNGKTFSEVVRFKLSDNKVSIAGECTLGGEPFEAVTLDFVR
jgi:hypothetical protein